MLFRSCRRHEQNAHQAAQVALRRSRIPKIASEVSERKHLGTADTTRFVCLPSPSQLHVHRACPKAQPKKAGTAGIEVLRSFISTTVWTLPAASGFSGAQPLQLQPPQRLHLAGAAPSCTSCSNYALREVLVLFEYGLPRSRHHIRAQRCHGERSVHAPCAASSRRSAAWPCCTWLTCREP